MKSVRKLTETWKQTKNLHEESCTEKLKRIPVSAACIDFASQTNVRDDRCNAERFEENVGKNLKETVTEASTSYRRTSKRLAQKDTSQSQGTPSQINRKQIKFNQTPDILKPFFNNSQLQKYNADSTCNSGNVLLSSWGIPPLVLEKYEECGVKSMFEWQAECLGSKRVLEGGNLVYSAPTSAGKTLVAEILMLKCVLERKKKAVMILPFVSVTHEKINNLRNLFQDAGVRVDGYMGNHSPPGGFPAVDIAVCTIEKANGLINRLIEENDLNSLGIIVVDELHMVGDPHRGYLLELLLTKVQYIQVRSSEKPRSLGSISNPIQIIGMSATLPNLDLLASWLRADLYCTNFRPVPLTESLKIGSKLYRADTMEFLRHMTKAVSVKDDQDHVVQLCLETICDGHGVLVFCPTKAWCEKLAETIARAIFELGKDDFQGNDNRETLRMHNKIREILDVEKLSETLGHLRTSPAGLDHALSKTIAFGVAFHHAGLTFDERDIIEGAFRRGTIKVLTATSTLSSGVNLPARRVIIRTPIFHGGALISVLSYKQMVGRAGRKGLDDAGESILICSEDDKHRVGSLTQSQLPPVYSCLQVNGQLQLSSSLKRAILEIIVSGVASTPQDVLQYIDHTLLAASARESRNENNAIVGCLQFLAENEFIKLQAEFKPSSKAKSSNSNDKHLQNTYVATSLGSAVLASALSPDEGLLVFQELERARRCFVLENELHVIYQVTPIYLSEQWSGIDWHNYWQMWEGLAPSFKRVGECVGVEERFLMRASRQGTAFSLSSPKQICQLRVHLRFYTALALHELVNEIPLRTVAQKFCCNRGMLQSLQQAAGTFAGMVTVFCHKLGWINLELLLAHFQNRLHFGIQQELCDLVRISCLNGLIARTLHNAGFKTVATVANATAASVEKVLRHAGPFESTKAKEDETAREALQRVKSHAVWLPGKKDITEREAAQIIIAEAREIVQQDFGVRNIEWTTTKGCSERNFKDNSRESVTAFNENLINENGVNETRSVKHHTLFNEMVNNISLKTAGNSTLVASVLKTVPTVTVKNHNDRDIEINQQAEKITSLKQNKETSQVQSLTLSQDHCAIVLSSNESPIAPHPMCESVNEMKTRQISSPSKVNVESANSLFDDELVLNTQVLENLDKSTRDCRSPVVTSLHFEENSDISNLGDQHCTLDTTAFSETQSLNLSALSDSDRTPSFTFYDKEEYLDQSTSLIDETPETPQRSNHSHSSDDVFIYDSLFNSTETVHSKEVSNDPIDNATREKSEVLAGCHESSAIVNIDGFSEELFTDTADVLKCNNDSHSPRDSSFEDGMLDVAVIFESEDVFSEEVDLPASKTANVNLTKAPISKDSDKSIQIEIENQKNVDILDEEQNSQFIPPTPTKPSNVNSKLYGNSRLTFRSDYQTINNDNSKLIEKNLLNDIGDTVTKNVAYKSIMPLSSNQEFAVSNTATSEGIKEHPSSISVKLIRQALPTEPKTMNVFADKAILEKFMQMWSKKSKFAFAFAGEKPRQPDIPIKSVIGHNILKGKHPPPKANEFLPKRPSISVCGADVAIVGMAVCWDSTPYYIDFLPTDNCSIRTAASELNQFLANLSKNFNRSQPTMIISYDLKDQLRALYHVCGVLPSNILGQDPRVASWLLDPEFSKLTIYELIEKYLPHRLCLLKDFTAVNHQGGIALHVGGQKSACVRATAEVISALELMEQLSVKMQDSGLISTFNDIEMASLIPLVKLELNGFGVCGKELERHRIILETKLKELENVAFALAGHKFPLASSKEVAKVLYSELKLSPKNVFLDNEDEELQMALPMVSTRLRGSPTSMLKRLRPRGQSFVGKTNRSTLQKFDDCHDLPKVVLEWRQINNSLNKIVIPMSELKQYDNRLKIHRLYSSYSTFTATGRVAAADPSVQMVPRDFFINLPITNGENDKSKIVHDARRSKTSQTKAIDVHLSHKLILRHSFIACQDAMLVAADYSQLELRVLAHLSQDEDLILALNKDTDVFKSIAAKWKSCAIEDVTDELRQQAKQICYGMIYGIGAKSLGISLHVAEAQAAAFIESFKSKYPGVQKFIRSTIDKCKKLGYVETMMGRRRYLPSISSCYFQAQQHAERQAINTTVQGSAADIVKKAMIGIDKQLEEEFLQTKKPLSHRFWQNNDIVPTTHGLPRGGFLVLQLHDELIYETSKEDVVQVAQIVKMNMERMTQLLVKLTVKIKLGPSWGSLKEVDI